MRGRMRGKLCLCMSESMWMNVSVSLQTYSLDEPFRDWMSRKCHCGSQCCLLCLLSNIASVQTFHHISVWAPLYSLFYVKQTGTYVQLGKADFCNHFLMFWKYNWCIFSKCECQDKYYYQNSLIFYFFGFLYKSIKIGWCTFIWHPLYMLIHWSEKGRQSQNDSTTILHLVLQ